MRALAVSLSLFVVIGCGAAAPRPLALTPAEAAPAAPPLAFDLLAGGTWASAQHAGQVIVVDVWASYCEPCKKAFPQLNVLAADPRLAVVGVSIDEEDAAAAAFLAQVPARFPIARDPAVSVATPPLSIAQVPTVLVIDRAGRLRLRLDDATAADYAALPELLAPLLAP
ncbi:MAG: TlpA disulfide reductase family protein [Kofleriaceae bacterium]